MQMTAVGNTTYRRRRPAPPSRRPGSVRSIAKSLDKRTLEIVVEVIGLLDLEELCRGMLLNQLPADLPHTISLAEPEVPRKLHVVFAKYALQNPLVDYYMRTMDGRALRFSDLLTRRELHRLDLYREVYVPLGVEYQIAFTLPSASHQVLGIALSRGKRDFTATERDLLNLVRPYLIQAYRNALAHTELTRGAGRQIVLDDLTTLGLTRRQVAMGRSDHDAAAVLGIAVRTAQKHLEHCYRTLGVSDRSQAARLAWEATETDE
jgi:hypothetical protein